MQFQIIVTIALPWGRRRERWWVAWQSQRWGPWRQGQGRYGVSPWVWSDGIVAVGKRENGYGNMMREWWRDERRECWQGKRWAPVETCSVAEEVVLRSSKAKTEIIINHTVSGLLGGLIMLLGSWLRLWRTWPPISILWKLGSKIFPIFFIHLFIKIHNYFQIIKI